VSRCRRKVAATAGSKPVRSVSGQLLIAPRRLLIVIISTPLRIVKLLLFGFFMQ